MTDLPSPPRLPSNPHGRNPNGPTLHGIDVAEPQGSLFNWDLVRTDGIDFAWMKVTQGIGYVDPTFARNWTESKRAGVLRGGYHFLSPDSDPIRQAEHFLRKLGKLDDTDLHPMLDVEADHGKPAAMMREYARLWLEKVKAETGRAPVFYTYPSFARTIGLEDSTSPIGAYDLWIAHYAVDQGTGKVYTLSNPLTPKTWGGWKLWQTSGNRGPRIPGIPFDVDRDVFWGSLADFYEAFTLAKPLVRVAASVPAVASTSEPQPVFDGPLGVVVPPAERSVPVSEE